MVKPGQTFQSVDKGVYNVLVWRGKGRYGGYEVEGLQLRPRRTADHARRGGRSRSRWRTPATEDLIIFKFFGPDINLDIPYLKHYA